MPDALLLLSFGGPEAQDEVVPFLERVTAGRGIPPERLVEVGAHYSEFGGRSPLNDQNRDLIAALKARIAERGLDLPVYWGNRNWHPFVSEAVAQMSVDGIKDAIVFATSAYSSYSGCRQYREDLAGAAAEVAQPPKLIKIPPFYDNSGFIDPMIDNTVAAVVRLIDVAGGQPLLMFTTHSIPNSAAANSGPTGDAYVTQHRFVAQAIVDEVSSRLGRDFAWELVFQSRSGPPQVPWLEPDIGDRLAELAGEVDSVAIVPVGFTSDHIEVLWDLDRVALEVAAEHGIPAERVPTVGLDPRYVDMIIDLALAPIEPCAIDCCPAPTRPGAGR